MGLYPREGFECAFFKKASVSYNQRRGGGGGNVSGSVLITEFVLC